MRLFLVLAILLSISCKHRSTSNIKDTSGPADKGWVQKAYRLLTLEEPDHNTINELSQLTKQQVVRKLMSQKSFGDAALDFSLYFLGFKKDSIKTNDSYGNKVYQEFVYDKPQAIAAAQAALNNGDFLSLFNYNQSIFIKPISSLYIENEVLEKYNKDGQSSFEDRLKIIVTEFTSKYGEASKFLTTNPDINSACQRFLNIDYELDSVDAAKVPAIGEIFAELEKKVSPGCLKYNNVIPEQFRSMGQGFSDPSISEIQDLLLKIQSSLPKMFEILRSANAKNYKPDSVKQINKVNTGDFSAEWVPNRLSSDGFWEHFPNSSTSGNRLRATYILKTYFCDDLTPLNLAFQKADHSKNRHASDPACQSCHYKLDPMAGFFRHKGVDGLDFKNKNTMIFDDLAALNQADYQKYLASWSPPNGDIGYYTSPHKKAPIQGDELPDLFNFIKNSKRSKA